VKVSAFPDTRTIYVELVEQATSAESDEIADGVVVDDDAAGADQPNAFQEPQED
jgi:hypothetical protein